jgi:hypothetical protein
MYPVRYEADFVEERNRATTIFRWILAIPWFIVLQIYAIGAGVVAFLAWFALLFTGRYPEGLYNFNAGFLRFTGRVNGWVNLQTDEWPSFGFGQDPAYPIRVEVDAPLESYNRWKVFFRLIVGIPVMFMSYLMASLYPLAAAVAWFHIAFTGRTSGGIHNVLTVGLAYIERTAAYFLLLTETFPPVSDQAPAANLKAGKAASKKPAARKPAAKKPAPKKK